MSIRVCNCRCVDFNFCLSLSIPRVVFSLSPPLSDLTLCLGVHSLCGSQYVCLFSARVFMELSVPLSVTGCLPFSLALSVSLLFLTFAKAKAALLLGCILYEWCEHSGWTNTVTGFNQSWGHGSQAMLKPCTVLRKLRTLTDTSHLISRLLRSGGEREI